MSTITSATTAARPLIYAENHVRERSYRLSDAKIAQCLGDLADRFQVVLHEAATPDLDALARAEYFVSLRFDTKLLRDVAKSLRVVHCLNAGVERYAPFDWLSSNATLTNSSGIHADMIGEYGLMALLMLNRRIPAYVALQRAARWSPTLVGPIRGKTVLIIGTGGLGSAIAEQATLLGINVIGINRSGKPATGFPEVRAVGELDALLGQADFVVLACPLTESTRGLFNAARIASMKPGAGLINVARGAVLDTRAMVDALKRGHLSGVVADVVDVEPLPADDPLWQVDGLLITPHVSCDTSQGYVERGLAIFADNLRREALGDTLRNIVDRRFGY